MPQKYIDGRSWIVGRAGIVFPEIIVENHDPSSNGGRLADQAAALRRTCKLDGMVYWRQRWLGRSTNNTITNTGSDIGLPGFASSIAAGAIPTSVDLGHSGFIGGGQIGNNWQSGNWVFGIEADFSGANLKSDATVGPIAAGGFVPQTTTYSRKLDWLATFRGRIGIIATPEFFLYGTGGLAVGHTKIGNAYICPSCAPPASSESTTSNNDSNTETGWTVGAGLEWMFAPHWSVKAEYLYVDLGSHDSTITYTFVGSTTTMTSSFRDRENIARAGINYHF